MLRPAVRLFGVVIGRVCLDTVVPGFPCWGRWFYGGHGVGVAGLAVLDWIRPSGDWLYGGGEGDWGGLLLSLWITFVGKVRVILVARSDWVGLAASGGWIAPVRHMLLWFLPELFRWSQGGSDVVLMRLGAWWIGWAETGGLSAPSVLGESVFNPDLSGCLVKGGAMVVEGRHGWWCDGHGGPTTKVVVQGLDRIVGWCDFVWAEPLTLELGLGPFWAFAFYFLVNYYLSFSFLFLIISYHLLVWIGRVYSGLHTQCTWSGLVRGRPVCMISGRADCFCFWDLFLWLA